MKQRPSPKDKAHAEMFMSLRELSVVVGIPINKLCSIAKMPGFPLFQKKVTYGDFKSWYRNQLSEAMAKEQAQHINRAFFQTLCPGLKPTYLADGSGAFFDSVSGAVYDEDGIRLGSRLLITLTDGASAFFDPASGTVYDKSGSVLGRWKSTKLPDGTGAFIDPATRTVYDKCGSLLGQWKPKNQ